MVQSTVESLPEAVVDLTEEALIRVLHVDDEAGFLKTAKQILEMQGNFQVDTASSVEEAREKMKEKTFDVIVSDYQMPGKDGLQFLKELREDGNNIPFIMFTGKGREEVAIEALNLGADFYLHKHGSPRTVYGELAHSTRKAVNAKRAEQMLRESEERYRNLYESVPDALAVYVGREGHLIDYNEAFKEWCGYSDEELKNRIFLDFVHPDDQAMVLKKYRTKYPEDELPRVYEIKGINKKGEIIPTEISVGTFKKKGRVIGINVMHRDISDRKKVEDALTKSEEKYRSLVELAPDSIMTFDLNGVVTSCNDAASRLSGYSKDELVGKHFSELGLLPEGDIPKYLEMLDSTVGGKAPKPFDVAWQHKDGTSRIGEVRFSLMGEKDETTGIQAIMRDITERKKAEEEIRNLAKFPSENTNPVLRLAKDGVILYANAASQFLLGEWKTEIGKPAPSQWRQYVADILTSGLKKEIEVKHRDQIFSFLLAPISDAGYVNVYGQDITERRKMKDKVLQQNEFLNDALESLTHPFYVVDANDYTIKMANSAAGFGTFSEKSTCYRLAHKRKKPCKAEHPCPLEIVKKTKKPAVVEHIHFDKEGNARNVEVHGYPIFDSDGNVVQMIEYCLDITERKEVERKIKKTSEEWKETFDAITDFVFILDKDHRFVRVNRATCDLLNKEPEDLIGKRCFEVLHGTNKPIENYPCEKMLVTKKTETIETHDPVLDKTFLINVSPLLDDKDEYIGCVHIARDITERKKTEEKIRESAERLRAILASSPDSVTVTDLHGNITECNQATVDMHGFSSKEELIGKSGFEFIAKKDRQRAMEDLKKILEQGSVKNIQYTCVTKDGRGFLAEFSASVIKDPSGNLTGFVAITKNISERKKTEKALKESEEKYKNIFELAPDAIAIMNLKGVVTSVNPTFLRLTGFSRDEIVDRHFTKIGTLRARNLPKYVKMLGSILRGKIPSPIEFVYLRKDGAQRWGEAHLSLLKKQGKQVGLQAILRDITKRKKTLEKLETLNEKLSVVGKLTRHDIRNKLQVVTSNAYLAQQMLTDDHETTKYLGEIESACEQTERILDFASTYEKLGVDELAFVNVAKSLEETVSLFPDLDGVEVVYGCDGLTVLADSLLRQLFYNLIDNSLKHGKKVSQIRVYYEEAGNDKLKLVYEDDGVGIRKAEKEKIFKEGYGKDSGYGLYLIRKMCEVYGWTIQETGKQGKGAQFTITIPKENDSGKITYRLR